MQNQSEGIDWAAYSAAQQSRDVRPLCRQVLTMAGPGAGRTAVDLGCGLGRETRAMLDAGWRVYAIDGEPDTRQRVLATTSGANQQPTVWTVRYTDLDDLPACDLVYSGYSLPYAHPDDFARIWNLIRSRLRDGGWFAANLFGDHDESADDPTMTFLSIEAAHAVLDGMDILTFNEEEGEGGSFTGPRYWHLYDIIARQPESPRDRRTAADPGNP